MLLRERRLLRDCRRARAGLSRRCVTCQPPAYRIRDEFSSIGATKDIKKRRGSPDTHPYRLGIFIYTSLQYFQCIHTASNHRRRALTAEYTPDHTLHIFLRDSLDLFHDFLRINRPPAKELAAADG